ncbi:YtxH domain-containing protein [Sporosarcina oncorhynchi]|uniref:YtxH domain-containing protein n=1 Tax=Sporosarcina oncorhynchi TaxID=3056444 RepID=A0ABZ0L359_9BACL|nr:YtxH domain-containing protein [Sporosarcina sp. T2O-4]WOV86627.1 YtxH domain-containing protein [Sporosarcina sp. T2O-4]
MGKSKFGLYIIGGAVVGAAVSMLDKTTRRHVLDRSNRMTKQVGFYAKNPEELKQRFQETKDKYVSIYEQFSGDAAYIKSQVEELKTLTPQVKELVVDTKEAFVDSKEDYKDIVHESHVNSASKKI